MESVRPAYEIIRQIDILYRAFVAPVAAFIGISGNILIMVVFIRGRIRRFEWYCITLAMANGLAVIFNTLLDDFLGRGMSYHTNGTWTFQPNLWSTGACQFLELVPTMMYFCSAYIMIVFTFDRCLVMSYPFKFIPNSHLLHAVCISGAVFLLSCGISIPLVISHEVVGDVFRSCEVKDSPLSIVSLYMKSIIIFVLPTITIVILNSVIVSKLLSMKRYQKNTAVLPISDPEMNRIFGHMALSIAFFFLTFPLSVVIILRLAVNKGKINNDSRSVLTQISKLFSAIKDLSYCCNFFLYLIFLPKFRKHISLLVKCRCEEIRYLLNNNESLSAGKVNRTKVTKFSREERLLNSL